MYTYACWQIYNEQVRDLFGHGGGGHGLRVREHPTKGAFVEGLSARPVTSYQQVQQLLEDGMSARRVFGLLDTLANILVSLCIYGRFLRVEGVLRT